MKQEQTPKVRKFSKLQSLSIKNQIYHKRNENRAIYIHGRKRQADEQDSN